MTVRTEVLASGTHIQRFVREERVLSWRDVIDAWVGDPEFRRAYAAAIADAPFDALFWECAPLTTQTMDGPFEHALVESSQLARLAPDPTVFASQFAAAAVVTFPNLGRDAKLVVPSPLGDEGGFAHLATFLRSGPPDQVDALFEQVGHAVREAEISPLWVSTSGLGVAWVHVRLDSRPKYYTHAGYRSPG